MMDARLQRRIQRYGWDKASDCYERYWAEQLAPAQTSLLELADLQPGESVVDIACGTGLVTIPAAHAVGASGRVVATDISERMVEQVRDLAAQLALRQITAQRQDAEDLRLEDEQFDVTLCALGLMYVPDPIKALTEQRRFLKPGGRALAVVWGQRDRCGWAEIFPIVDSRVESDVCPLFFQLGTQDNLRYAFETAGFTDVETRRINTSMRYESAEEALGAAFAGGPVALAYARFDDRTRQAAHGEYLESIAPYRNGSGYFIPGEFVIAIGHKRSAATD